MDNSQVIQGEIWRSPDDTLMGPLAAFRVYYWDMQKYESRWEIRVKGGDTEGEVKEGMEGRYISFRGKEVYCEDRNPLFFPTVRKKPIDIIFKSENQF